MVSPRHQPRPGASPGASLRPSPPLQRGCRGSVLSASVARQDPASTASPRQEHGVGCHLGWPYPSRLLLAGLLLRHLSFLLRLCFLMPRLVHLGSTSGHALLPPELKRAGTTASPSVDGRGQRWHPENAGAMGGFLLGLGHLTLKVINRLAF